MRSPQDMETIQIDITNACIHSCSNCTRACGHHKNNFFMDWFTFKRAVDSLSGGGFNGTIGIMGGEPTLHPEFERFVKYLNENQLNKKKNTDFIKPTKNFMKQMYYDIRENYNLVDKSDGSQMLKVTGSGLWSSLASNYYKYYELIQDVFNYQCLNDHQNISYHQPVLVSRKDLNIPDDEWIELRDKCWIQNNWSATITPKGAFFCEVAGALDMLFNGDGGWPIEVGWWKRKPVDFKDQLHWCELCGLALDTRRRNANEEIDDISPTLYEKLKQVESPKVKKGNISIYFNDENETEKKNKELQFFKNFNYISGYSDRLSDMNKNIYPKGFETIVFYNEEIEYAEFIQNINTNLKQFDKIIIITNKTDIYNNLVKTNLDNKVLFLNGTNLNFGSCINLALRYTDNKNFVLVLSCNLIARNDFDSLLKKYVINPGVCHFNMFKGNDKIFTLLKKSNEIQDTFALLFHINSYAIKLAGYDGIKKCNNIKEFKLLWSENKQIIFEDNLFKEGEEYLDIDKDSNYVIYGIGGSATNITHMVEAKEAYIKYYCDSNSEKWNNTFMDKLIISPTELVNRKNEYSKIIIGSMRAIEIKDKLLKLGFDENDIIYPKWKN